MQDLGQTMFYKVKFSVDVFNKEDDLLWKIVCHVMNWISRKWNKKGKNTEGSGSEIVTTDKHLWSQIKYGNYSIKENHITIYSNYVDNENAVYWACMITETSIEDEFLAPREWISEFGFKQSPGEAAEFSCVLSYRDRPGYIGEIQPEPSRSFPRVVRNILNDKSLICRVGFDRLMERAQELSIGKWDEFWRRLKSPERVFPYIVIMPVKKQDDPEEGELFLDPDKLQRAVFGNALVFYSTNPLFNQEMKTFCPEAYICRGGSLRIYYSDLDDKDEADSYRHRFLPRSKVESLGEDGVIDILYRALVTDILFYEDFVRIDTCKRKKRDYCLRKRQQELLEAEEGKKKLAIENDKLIKEKQEIQNSHDRTELDFVNLDDDYKVLQKEFRKIQAENDNYKTCIQKYKSKETAENSREKLDKYPAEPADIANYFVKVFGDRMDFSEDGLKSLKSCEIPPDTLWDLLFQLATKMYRYYFEDDCSDAFNEFNNTTSYKAARSEGRMTRKDNKLMRQFQTKYNNIMIDIEPHITFPKQKQSIHFGFLEGKENKIIIGHCGKHLDIYSTQKQH